MSDRLRFTFLGLSYRALYDALLARGHELTFLEREPPRNGGGLPAPLARTYLYSSFDELRDRFASMIRESDLVVVASCLDDGAAVGSWAEELAPNRTAFYDIDTPVTLARLAAGEHDRLTPDLVRRYALYLSFTGGPLLRIVEERYGSPCARPLYPAVDLHHFFSEERQELWDLGYLGTYDADRHRVLERLLIEPARVWAEGRFVVAGDRYPDDYPWPANIARTGGVAPSEHRAFYNAQRFTLNVTRATQHSVGWSPNVRLFEAAACGTPIVTDPWPGLESFFVPGREVLVANEPSDIDSLLRTMTARDRRAVGRAARARVQNEHTADHRAETLERYTLELLERNARRFRVTPPFSDAFGARGGT